MKKQEVGRKIYQETKVRKRFFVVITSHGEMYFYDSYDEARESFEFAAAFGIPVRLLKIEVLDEVV